MKKRLSLFLALTLVFAMTVPALASDPTPDGGTSLVTYVVESSYQITIPSSGVTITGTSANAEVGVIAGGLIDAAKKLQFSISASTHYDAITDAGFCLQNGSDTTVFLDYVISCTGFNDIARDDVFLEASAEEVNNGKSIELTFTPDTAKQAGTYTETITFTVATVNV